MKPDVPVVLQKISQALLGQIGPEIRSDYAQRSALIATLLLQSAAEEWERGAARRVEENVALRGIFRDSLPAVEDDGLRQRMAAAAAEGDPNLHLSALDRSNDTLRGLLIELQAHVEELESGAARDVETAVWRELRRSTERRALSVAPF